MDFSAWEFHENDQKFNLLTKLFSNEKIFPAYPHSLSHPVSVLVELRYSSSSLTAPARATVHLHKIFNLKFFAMKTATENTSKMIENQFSFNFQACFQPGTKLESMGGRKY